MTVQCANCGFNIAAKESYETCECEACGSEWSIAALVGRLERIKMLKEQITAEMQSKRERAEEEKRLKDEQKRSEKKAELERQRAETAKINAEAKRIASGVPDQAENAYVNSGNGVQNVYSNTGNGTIVVNNINQGIGIANLMPDAMASFLKRDYSEAERSARQILTEKSDEPVATFISSYTEEIVKGRSGSLKKCLPELSGHISDKAELENLTKLFLSAVPKLAGCEQQVLSLVYNNRELIGNEAVCRFVDAFSAPLVINRKDRSFMSRELAETYQNLAEYCSIPKTCQALVMAVENNPESPLKNGQTYMQERNTYFYRELVEPVGEIVRHMRSKNRQSFVDAYEKRRQMYCSKTGIS